ncbi:MAG: hypothetical protein V2A58_11290 [Planctomycetota bacterium]
MKIGTIIGEDGKRITISARRERCEYYADCERPWIISLSNGDNPCIAPQRTRDDVFAAVKAAWGRDWQLELVEA